MVSWWNAKAGMTGRIRWSVSCAGRRTIWCRSPGTSACRRLRVPEFPPASVMSRRRVGNSTGFWAKKKPPPFGRGLEATRVRERAQPMRWARFCQGSPPLRPSAFPTPSSTPYSMPRGRSILICVIRSCARSRMRCSRTAWARSALVPWPVFAANCRGNFLARPISRARAAQASIAERLAPRRTRSCRASLQWSIAISRYGCKNRLGSRCFAFSVVVSRFNVSQRRSCISSGSSWEK
jgi:hypothetical protein